MNALFAYENYHSIPVPASGNTFGRCPGNVHRMAYPVNDRGPAHMPVPSGDGPVREFPPVACACDHVFRHPPDASPWSRSAAEHDVRSSDTRIHFHRYAIGGSLPVRENGAIHPVRHFTPHGTPAHGSGARPGLFTHMGRQPWPAPVLENPFRRQVRRRLTGGRAVIDWSMREMMRPSVAVFRDQGLIACGTYAAAGRS